MLTPETLQKTHMIVEELSPLTEDVLQSFAIGMPLYTSDGDGIDFYLDVYRDPNGQELCRLTDCGSTWAKLVFSPKSESKEIERMLKLAKAAELQVLSSNLPRIEDDEYPIITFGKEGIPEDQLALALPVFAQSILKFDFAVSYLRFQLTWISE